MEELRDCAELLSYNVRRLRKLRKMSQLELAEKADLSVTFINSIENKQKWLSAKSLAKIAGALGCQPHELFLPKYIDENSALNIVNEHTKMIADLKEMLSTYDKNKQV